MRRKVAESSLFGPCMILAILAALMVLGPATGALADPPLRPSDDAVTAPLRVNGGSALMGFIDPETGALRAPTEEELQEMGAMAAEAQGAARTPPRVYYREDGSVVSVLGTSSLDWLKARKSPDGSLMMGHGLSDQNVNSRAREDR